MSNKEKEKFRRLLLRAAAHCPSSCQCLQGNRELLSVNSKLALEAILDALELLTGIRGNFEEVAK